MASVKRALCEGKADLVVIPGEQASVLWPLDIVLNKPFKDRVWELCSEWMVATTDHFQRPPGTSTAVDCLWLGVIYTEIAH